MQYKIWYIKISGNKEGPYSIDDLKRHPQMTPDTLVWKEGFNDWIQARNVPELDILFEDEEQPVELKDKFKIEAASPENSILALESSNFPSFFFWLFAIILILFVYAYYQWQGY